MRRNSHHQDQLADEVHVDVRCEPDAVAEDRPVLSRDWPPFHGECWVLCYVDELGRFRQQHFPGTVADVDRAVEAATEFLAPLRELRARRAAAVGTLLAWAGRLPGSPTRRGQDRFGTAGLALGLVVVVGTVLWPGCHRFRRLTSR